MASFRFTKLKITAGYTLLLAILLFSLVFVHREMEAFLFGKFVAFLYIGSIKYVHNVTYWFLFLELIWSRIRAANS